MWSSRGWQLMTLLLIISVLAVQCHKKSESHEEESGEKHGGDHFSEESHKGEKGHHNDESYEKGEKGKHGKEEESHHFDEVFDMK